MRTVLLAPVALLAFALASCASPSEDGAPGAGSDGPVVLPVDVAVRAQGTVLQKGDATPQLCLGPIAESYPPQCGGPEILEWDWDAVDDEESASGVTWGSYAVTGMWDGESFTLTQPAIPLALYDPLTPDPDPRSDPATPGKLTDDEVTAIQDELAAERDTIGYLGSYPDNGYLWVEVMYDDGAIQSWLDESYGEGRIAVISTLQPVS